MPPPVRFPSCGWPAERRWAARVLIPERSKNLSPNVETAPVEFWKQLEGQIAGSYPLRNWLGGTSRGAVYATEYGEQSHPAAIKVMPADTQDAEGQLGRWSSITQLSHPHLIRIFDSGASDIDGVPLIYVVMERADDSLANVLAERCLTPAETREMLEPALAALGYLHGRGFVHGGIKPSNILAIGDQLKLSSDGIVAIDEETAVPAGDVWSVGATIVQALTQRSIDSKLEIPENLPEPFLDIARHCLLPDPQSRWTVGEIAARLKGPPTVAPIPLLTNDRSLRKRLYGIVAAGLAVIALLVLLGRRRGESPEPMPAPQAAVSTNVTQPPPARSVDAPVRNARRVQGWFVVAATYARRQDAEKRAREIARKWPRFKTEIYTPPVRNPHYLVVLGANLSEEAARELQKRARSAGLPRDTYIKRFPG